MKNSVVDEAIRSACMAGLPVEDQRFIPGGRHYGETPSKAKHGFTDEELASLSAKTSPSKGKYKDAKKCITFDRKSNSEADLIINKCNVYVEVRWKDSGFCSTGCRSEAPAGKKTAIYKMKGKARFTACQDQHCVPKQL